MRGNYYRDFLRDEGKDSDAQVLENIMSKKKNIKTDKIEADFNNFLEDKRNG